MKSTPPHFIRTMRQLAPTHPMTLDEGLRLAERHAALALAMTGAGHPAVDLGPLGRLPGVDVHYVSDLAVTGIAERINGRWVIAIRGNDHITCRRLTLAREFWRVLTHGGGEFLADAETAHRWATRCAEHFAANLLMPRGRVYEAWACGVQESRYLAASFQVPPDAMRHRLDDLGLTTKPQRRARAVSCAA